MKMNFCRYRMQILLNKACQQAQFSTRPVVTLDESVNESITKEHFKPRNHPGVVKPRTITVPEQAIKAIERSFEDYPIKSFVSSAEQLVNHLKGRVPPMEKEEVQNLAGGLKKKVIAKMEADERSQVRDEETLERSFNDRMHFMLKQKVYNWQPVNYDTQTCLTYLVGRFAPEYAVLTKIFTEISQRDKEFRPQSLFDFGSGVGTVTWAARQFWQKSIVEYFNVDVSSDMNDLALTLLKDGRANKETPIKGVFYRQFLPVNNTPYDLVVSAYTLLELPDLRTRLDTLVKLWNKTSKYLVLVEQGTNGGFRVINEARDFILHIKDPLHKGHVFSPCPHDNICPRFVSKDNTPCNFMVKYFPLPFGKQQDTKRELYSYVVLKKGERSPDDDQWPRIVREVLVRTKHSICRLCTSKGHLQEVIFSTAKQGKTTYHCARSSKWGDLLPMKIEEGDSDGGVQK